MKKEEAVKALTANMIALCGPAEGLRRGRTVIPAILNDFEKTLLKQSSGGTDRIYKETYRLDDGTSTIDLKGRRVGEKGVEITEVCMNDRVITV